MINPEIECPTCDGEGIIVPKSRMGQVEDCAACAGSGFRPMTQDEIDDAAADAFSDMCEGEPPVTMAEQHRAAWDEKQRLRS